MTELPKGPWEHVKADFFGPLPSGDYILEVVDVYSRSLEIEIVRSTSVESTVPKLDKMFSAFGIPDKLTTDNGPPFNSHEFRKFTVYLGIKHQRITRLWPQANSSAENFNRMLRKVVQSPKIEGKNWKQEIYRYLRNYRSTPHISTGKAPAEIIFSSRTYRTKLPQIGLRYDDKDIRERASLSKAADSNRNVKKSNFKIADTVLVKQRQVNKLTPPFSPDPLKIIRIKGSMIIAKSVKTAITITRNTSFFKKIPSRKKGTSHDDQYEISINGDGDNVVQNEDVHDDVAINRNEDTTDVENGQFEPRRNPPRERNRPGYLRDDIRNLLNTGE